MAPAGEEFDRSLIRTKHSVEFYSYRAESASAQVSQKSAFMVIMFDFMKFH